ncbi:DUF3267 domain-containing protein [Brochothrix campestris]|uniref:DUF3267 domain-containing protein n=1 Tax=Brochothrix campestris FSL F6-1037 TaxID=1265861 RepID=W7C823_9LIST|nr:DUF3267 domain-containing protein [Brochothrix campestris]EUJ35619.1 hypothetical protein BCAMP_11600 [Brochothrix campestris FSL F6-1037]
MHCIRSIKHEQEESFYRLFIVSFLVFITVLSTLIITHHLLLGNNYTYQYPLIGFLILLLIYPFHKLFHYIIMPDKREIYLQIQRHFVVVPFIEVKLDKAVPKRRYLFALITPFLTMSLLWLLIYYYYDLKSVYMYLALAIHLAICTTDIYCFFTYLKFPNNSFIEDSSRGVRVLIKDEFDDEWS